VTRRWETRAGSVVLTERSSAIPVVGFGISVRSGALHDPPGKEGLCRMMSRAIRMGTRDLTSQRLEEQLDGLGAQLSISASQSYLHFGGAVVKHNLEPFVDILAELVLEPALRPADVRQVQREMVADLTSLVDDDRSLCARNFRSQAFGSHVFGRPRGGSKQSIGTLTRADVLAAHERHFVGPNLVFGVWGDFEPRALHKLIEKRFGGMAKRKAPNLHLADPSFMPGRRIVVVDKPERTQTQVLIGTLGLSAHDRDYVPLIVGNTGFGGLFSSRLNDEVRSKRGLSYGASSSFTLSRGRDLWVMHTFPAAADARRCIELQLDLYDKWIEHGLRAQELIACKRYLQKSHAFEIDTAGKRLDQKLDVELFGWPKNHHTGFVDAVAETTREEVGRALHHRLSRKDQLIALVATASQIVPELQKLPNVAKIDVIPFDRV
jgi:zinc protease